jgi:hypothetical protein
MFYYKEKLAKEDIRLWDGKSETFERETLAGGTVTLHKVGEEIDVAFVYGNGKRDSMAIRTALNTLGSTNCTFLLTPGEWEIAESVSIPKNIVVHIPNGAAIKIKSGAQFKAETIKAGKYPIFKEISGELSLNEAHAEWFFWDGATEANFQKAINCSKQLTLSSKIVLKTPVYITKDDFTLVLNGEILVVRYYNGQRTYASLILHSDTGILKNVKIISPLRNGSIKIDLNKPMPSWAKEGVNGFPNKYKEWDSNLISVDDSTKVEGFLLDGIYFHAPRAASFVLKGENITIKNNTFYNCCYNWLEKVIGATVSSNVFDHCGQISLERARGVVYANNLFRHIKWSTLDIFKSQNVAFINNYFYLVKQGIHLKGTSNCLICGNFVYNAETHAYHVSGSDRAVYVWDSATKDEFEWGDIVYVRTDADGNLINEDPTDKTKQAKYYMCKADNVDANEYPPLHPEHFIEVETGKVGYGDNVIVGNYAYGPGSRPIVYGASGEASAPWPYEDEPENHEYPRDNIMVLVTEEAIPRAVYRIKVTRGNCAESMTYEEWLNSPTPKIAWAKQIGEEWDENQSVDWTEMEVDVYDRKRFKLDNGVYVFFRYPDFYENDMWEFRINDIYKEDMATGEKIEFEKEYTTGNGLSVSPGSASIDHSLIVGNTFISHPLKTTKAALKFSRNANQNIAVFNNFYNTGWEYIISDRSGSNYSIQNVTDDKYPAFTTLVSKLHYRAFVTRDFGFQVMPTFSDDCDLTGFEKLRVQVASIKPLTVRIWVNDSLVRYYKVTNVRWGLALDPGTEVHNSAGATMILWRAHTLRYPYWYAGVTYEPGQIVLHRYDADGNELPPEQIKNYRCISETDDEPPGPDWEDLPFVSFFACKQINGTWNDGDDVLDEDDQVIGQIQGNEIIEMQWGSYAECSAQNDSSTDCNCMTHDTHMRFSLIRDWGVDEDNCNTEFVGAFREFRFESVEPRVDLVDNGGRTWARIRSPKWGRLEIEAPEDDEYGSNLIQNGSFDDDSEWDWGYGWSHNPTRKTAVHEGMGGIILQEIDIEPERTYKISFYVYELSGGELWVSLGGSACPDVLRPGPYCHVITLPSDLSSSNLAITSSHNAICEIDDVSVQEVLDKNLVELRLTKREIRLKRIAVSDRFTFHKEGTDPNRSSDRYMVLASDKPSPVKWYQFPLVSNEDDTDPVYDSLEEGSLYVIIDENHPHYGCIKMKAPEEIDQWRD